MTTLEDIKARFAEGWTPYMPEAGWDSLLIEMHDKLVAADPDIKYIQIKQKFGELRVYTRPVTPTNPQVAEAIREAVIRSRVTCERCGETGKLRQARSWLITLCDGCEAARRTSATL